MPIVMPMQSEPNWCWAAVTVSVNGLFSSGSTLTQCAVAKSVLAAESEIGRSVDCCANPEKCNLPAYLQDGLNSTGNLAQIDRGILDFVGVTTELDAGRPVGVRIRWPDGGGHFLLIDGYREFSSAPEQVHVADPYYGPAYILYSDLVNNYQDGGIWAETFLVQPATGVRGIVSTNPDGGTPGSNILVIGPIVIGGQAPE